MTELVAYPSLLINTHPLDGKCAKRIAYRRTQSLGALTGSNKLDLNQSCRARRTKSLTSCYTFSKVKKHVIQSDIELQPTNLPSISFGEFLLDMVKDDDEPQIKKTVKPNKLPDNIVELYPRPFKWKLEANNDNTTANKKKRHLSKITIKLSAFLSFLKRRAQEALSPKKNNPTSSGEDTVDGLNIVSNDLLSMLAGRINDPVRFVSFITRIYLKLFMETVDLEFIGKIIFSKVSWKIISNQIL